MGQQSGDDQLLAFVRYRREQMMRLAVVKVLLSVLTLSGANRVCLHDVSDCDISEHIARQVRTFVS